MLARVIFGSRSLAWGLPLLLLLTSPAQAQTSPIVRVSSFEYDAAGMLIKEVIEPNSANDCLQTTHTYSPQGNPASSSSSACAGASGHAISSASTARGSAKGYVAQTVTINSVSYTSPAGVFATSSTNALNQSESYEYDPRHGQITKLTGPNGGVTTWIYDSFGRKTRENRADGTYTLWSHASCQAAGQALDPVCANPVGYGGFTHVAEWYVREVSYGSNGVALTAAKYQMYDPLGRAVRTRSDSFMSESVAANRYPSIQDTVYNGLGQVVSQSNAYLQQGGSAQWSSYEYDDLGRVVKETSPDGNGGTAILQTAYNGLETVTTNALGQVKKSYKNASGQTERIEDAAGASVLYTYDALGQLTQTSAAGSTTKLSYDVRGRKTSMQDPAMGRWDYAYNAFGELVWQQDSLSQTVTMGYDLLGRMTSRTEPDLVSNWYHDQKANGSGCGAGIGKLCEATANNGYRRLHTYDTMGRPTSTSNVLDNAAQPAVTTQMYDSITGRLKEQTWPSGYKALYDYTEASANWSAGHLWKVRGMDGATQNALWQAQDKDPQGRLIRYLGGNGVETARTVEQATGQVKGLKATLGTTAGNVLNHVYEQDKLGNLKTRSDANTGVSETFSYDSINRLSMISTLGGNLAIQQPVQVLYDARGNIKYKSDVGYYHYDSQRPNRLTAITLAQENWSGATGNVTVPNSGSKTLNYAFDDYLPGVRNIDLGEGNIPLGNGNLMYTVSHNSVSGAWTARWEEYTSFNKIREMRFGNVNLSDPTNTAADRTVALVYGPEHQRLRQTITLTSNAPSHMEAGTTWYMNGPDSLGLSYEKEIKANGLIEHKHYLTTGGESFALHTQREGNLNGKPAKQVSYFHHDHLGSLAVISNEAGAVIERLAYDPWGKRRYSDGNKDPNDTLTSAVTDRGYTMHEHMDEMGVINMNGRVYDPTMGRFLTTDPYIQAPYYLQSFNRFAYVWNNPLHGIDPTGYGVDGAYNRGHGESGYSDASRGPGTYGGNGSYHANNQDEYNRGNGGSDNRVPGSTNAVGVVAPAAAVTPSPVKEKPPKVKPPKEPSIFSITNYPTLVAARDMLNQLSQIGKALRDVSKYGYGSVTGDEGLASEAMNHLHEDQAVNIGAMIGLGLSLRGKAPSANGLATTSAQARANELHSALDSRAQRARTTAVTETREGVRVISSSERRLAPSQRAQLSANEAEGVGIGHAEVTGINAAREMGLTPIGTAASRPICSSCANTLGARGVDALSPLK